MKGMHRESTRSLERSYKDVNESGVVFDPIEPDYSYGHLNPPRLRSQTTIVEDVPAASE